MTPLPPEVRKALAKIQGRSANKFFGGPRARTKFAKRLAKGKKPTDGGKQ
jgi:hypothetical protein